MPTRLPSPPPRRRRRSFRLGTEAGWAVLLALALGACSTNFDPYADGPPFFALDATLDIEDDTLFVRVQDLLVPPGAPPAPLDARVTLDDLATGQAVALRDSVAQLDDGGRGNLFWTTAPLRDGRVYRLQAARTADPTAVSGVDIELPAASVFVEQGGATPLLRVSGPLARETSLLLTYTVRRTDTGETTTIAQRYFPINATERFRVSLIGAARAIRFALDLPEGDPQQLAAVTDVSAAYDVASPAPLPIRDGRGQITWRARLVADWQVPTKVLAAVRLRDEQ